MTNSGKCGVNTAENTGREENTQREIGGSTVGIGRGGPVSSGLSPVHCSSGAAYCDDTQNSVVGLLHSVWCGIVLCKCCMVQLIVQHRGGCDNPDEDLRMNWLPMDGQAEPSWPPTLTSTFGKLGTTGRNQNWKKV